MLALNDARRYEYKKEPRQLDINALLIKHGNKIFKVDAEDELDVFMHIEGYKIHVRQDDVSLVMGMPISEFHPLIDGLQKV